MAGTLYLVATPIGNLEDITYRAVRILKEVAAIACEDTRQASKLLHHYQITTPTLSYHDHNEAARASHLCDRLTAGESLALISDAGTPLISDPGYRFVKEAASRGIPVVPIPGASSVMAALAASGLPTDRFTFAGFLPPKSGARQKLFATWAASEETIIVFEAPHRIAESLQDLALVLPHRPVVVARELTKLYEEFLRGTAAEVAAAVTTRGGLRGEITLLIGKSEGPLPAATPTTIREEVAALEAQGQSRNDAMKEVARRRGLGKREVYQAVHGLN
jgi:16S rRNA (cytidine1402-2'-O)-methyltransferase